ncbi:MAG: FumA C-terminus/TtdB family hydratase beta subunit [Coriobacteriales bacterium]|nr:FumA C-terminus/TtdB family hydratase beta subunit [Coriobacteriales bacterium]
MKREPIRLDLPADHADLRHLLVGDEVRLYGTVYTMRDAGHQRAITHIDNHNALPFDLKGEALFYAGPTPPAAGRPHGAIGPTTASRMDFATRHMLLAGITVTIGKGSRSPYIARACRTYAAVYLAVVGGAAAYLANFVTKSELIAWPDLGTEAVRRLTLENFPAFVAIDTFGHDFYDRPMEARR